MCADIGWDRTDGVRAGVPSASGTRKAPGSEFKYLLVVEFLLDVVFRRGSCRTWGIFFKVLGTVVLLYPWKRSFLFNHDSPWMRLISSFRKMVCFLFLFCSCCWSLCCEICGFGEEYLCRIIVDNQGQHSSMQITCWLCSLCPGLDMFRKKQEAKTCVQKH